MAAYRLKHLPTGLYFIPSRSVRYAGPVPASGPCPWYVKSNLSRTGKLYARQPSLKKLGGSYCDHTKPATLTGRYRSQVYPVIETDWMIEVVV